MICAILVVLVIILIALHVPLLAEKGLAGHWDAVKKYYLGTQSMATNPSRSQVTPDALSAVLQGY